MGQTYNLQKLFMADRISEREDHVRVNNLYCRVMYVETLPEQIHFGWMTPISYIPGVTVSITMHPYTYEKASDKIDSEKNKLGAELIYAEKHGDTRRMDTLNIKYAFYRQLLTEINMRRTNITSVSVVVTVTASDIRELDIKCDKIKDIMGATRLIPMYLKQIQGLKCVLPGVESIDEFHDVTVGNAACLSPLININISHPSGIYFGENETGSPCFLDLFIGQPRLFGPHMFITGMTRSGKSYTVKGMIARSNAIGRKVVVIDPEGEYKELATTFKEDAEYIRLHPSMEVMFNPFDVEPEVDDIMGEFIDIAGKVDDITSLICTVLEAQSGDKLKGEERSILSSAIRQEYTELGINKNPDSIYEYDEKETKEGLLVGRSLKTMPTFSSLSSRLERMGAIKLKTILSDFVKGGPLGFFDGQTAFKLREKHLVVFDNSALRNQLSKMYAMFVLLSWLWEKYVKVDKHIQKHIVVDEAWLMMAYPATAEFMSQIARRGAKYNTSLIAASQSFREFATEEGTVFLNQCATKLFLRMEPDDAKTLGLLFNLSPDLVKRISSFVPGQGILKMGNESGIVKFQGFSFEERFLRSDPGAVRAL